MTQERYGCQSQGNAARKNQHLPADLGLEADDRKARRYLNRLQKAQKRRNPKNAKGFG